MFQEFKQKFDEEVAAEAKVTCALEFMRTVLSSNESLKLKEFWEAKNLCIEAFKGEINPAKRKFLWSEYVELTGEAKRLKAILDEQSSFAIEQIELALDALEKDLKSAEEKTLDIPCPISIEEREAYGKWQGEFNALSSIGIRLTTLRKEAIDTEMRFKHRNRILKRVATLGDTLFPRKKEIVAMMSEQFVKDVDRYIHGPHLTRAGVQEFQNLAKDLSINSPAFKKTRKLLADGWDSAKKRTSTKPSGPPPFEFADEVESVFEKLSKGEDVKVELEGLKTKLKSKLDTLRREAGASNLDFEKAINVQEKITQSKEALQRVNDELLRL
ncbi:MAG: hypothetical protein SP1CHLAM54_02780 [Chlamydiia bacterium]|nr:hypothetical protein [Chlamydiia bacterium]MCH9615194.1 hypothetical protein [Chlamydiia bacterium]MCH9628484.1 hypothetical protein [Chlamydiia bacterium]